MDRYPHTLPPRRGPQIHAVPDHERALDPATGKRLPWAYDTLSASASALDAKTREPVEQGAFGKRNTMARRSGGGSRSRSKTAEPERREDAARREQERGEEVVFGGLGRKGGAREVLGEVDGNAGHGGGSGDVGVGTAGGGGKSASVSGDAQAEAMEVLLWGFGEDLQWAALEFYERVSGGAVLEDYERVFAGQVQRGFDSTAAARPYGMVRSISKAALRKKNRYAGGEHWIKVTFDSRQAGELAVARSPHIIKGCLVTAEPWQDRGPARDEAVWASQAGVQVTSEVLPPSFSTRTLVEGSGSPEGTGTGTLSSATERQTPPVVPLPPWAQQQSPTDSSATLTSGAQSQPTSTPQRQPHNHDQQQQLTQRTGSRIPTARIASLLPAEMALMPRQPTQSWTAWLGASELIGTTVPRTEDGGFDHARASFYWRAFWWVDGVFGTDFCGCKGDE
ncbi:hypothetical protein LTR08_008140 [Meristemomyces frigidus]|nr:hypothetical protein LTR08_008140 [Meristemomyces frigidus]